MPKKGEKAPGTGWANPNHPMHTQPKGKGVWGQLEPGHVQTLVHGALSARAVDPVARALVDETVATLPFLNDPSYKPALESWAACEAKARLLDAYIAQVGVVDDEGKPRAALDALRMWEARASSERDRLGLTPLSRAKLGRDVTATQVDLATIWARMEAEGSTGG